MLQVVRDRHTVPAPGVHAAEGRDLGAVPVEDRFELLPLWKYFGGILADEAP